MSKQKVHRVICIPHHPKDILFVGVRAVACFLSRRRAVELARQMRRLKLGGQFKVERSGIIEKTHRSYP